MSVGQVCMQNSICASSRHTRPPLTQMELCLCACLPVACTSGVVCTLSRHFPPSSEWAMAVLGCVPGVGDPCFRGIVVTTVFILVIPVQILTLLCPYFLSSYCKNYIVSQVSLKQILSSFLYVWLWMFIGHHLPIVFLIQNMTRLWPISSYQTQHTLVIS